jgi:RNA polymerase sigma-70 factor (ECF subfamily)
LALTHGNADIDARLVERARERDPRARRELAARSYGSVRRWARGWTDSAADADDLAQDVMVRMLRTLDQFAGDARFTSWLYALTRSAALDRRRSEGRERERREHPRAVENLRSDPAPDPELRAERRAELDALERLLDTLPERQREAFELIELQGMSSAEAGELLGIEPVSVRAHLHRARRALRTLILANHPHLAPDPR